MQIPDSLKIGAQTIAVKRLETMICKADGAENLGYASTTFCEISLADKATNEVSSELVELPEVTKADTFLHEIIHIVSSTYGIGLEEEQVAGLAGGLLAVIRDNGLDFRE